MICLYAGMTVVNPEIRPRLAEAVLGIALGIIADRLMWRYWIAYLVDISEVCAQRPDTKYLACIAHGAMYTKHQEVHVGVQLVVAFGGFMTIVAASLMLQLLVSFGSLPGLLTRYHAGSFDVDDLMASVMPTLFVYGLAVFATVSRRTLRWYGALDTRR